MLNLEHLTGYRENEVKPEAGHRKTSPAASGGLRTPLLSFPPGGAEQQELGAPLLSSAAWL